MNIIAHRGDCTNHLENTAAAFNSALRLGFPSLELDLLSLRDGTVVVFHDDDLNRLFSLSHRVAELELGDFREIFPDLLTFDEFYRRYRKTRAEVNLEIKDDVRTLERIAPRLKDFRQVVISAEKREIVDRAIRLGLEGAYLADDHDLIPNNMLGFRLHISCMDETFLERLPYLSRFRLYCYTVNDPSFAQKLCDFTHVRGIFTDNPALLSAPFLAARPN